MSSPSTASHSKEEYDCNVAVTDEVLPVDPIAERKLLRKLDLYLQPILGVIYMMCFLDRGNIGNALTAGMATELKLSANHKAAVVSLVYATYVTFECVWPLLIKKLTAKWTMSVALLGFGAVTVGTAFAKSFGALTACRLLLGMTEAGVFPCIVVYCSMIYRREELGMRISYIFVFSALSGAFGGLVAYGLVHITTGSLKSFQYIFLVEGVISLALVPLVFFWIPNRADEAWFLSSEEKQLCADRYELNKLQYSVDDTFEWKYIRATLCDITTYTHGMAQFPIDIALYGVSTFMPVFIKDFGFSAVNSQILTVPVYCVGAISFVIQAHFSDKLQLRGPFILANMAITLVGYIILAAVGHPVGVRYFALFIIGIGVYTPVGLNVTWTQANHTPHYKRAAAVGLMQLVGNSSGAAIGYIFKDSPRYIHGFSIASGICVFGMLNVVFMMWYYNDQNKKKRAAIAAGAPSQPELGNKNPHYLYMI